MEYNDEVMPSLSNIEEMARAYNFSLKEKGFVFASLEEEGKTLLLEEVFDLLFKLRSSYRNMGLFMASNNMLSLTEKNIDSLRSLFDYEINKGYMIRTNRTKCFVNSIALENLLSVKLLLLSQKCNYGSEILSIIIERAKTISENLMVDGTFQRGMF